MSRARRHAAGAASGVLASMRADSGHFRAMQSSPDYKFDAGDDECEKLVTGALRGLLLSSNGIEVD